MTFAEEGLVLGAGTVLAKASGDRCGRLAVAIDNAAERILALLAVAYGEAVDPTVLDHIRRASEQWSREEPCLALIYLAYTGLPTLPDPIESSFRLFLADLALTSGATPRDLLEACGILSTPLDSSKAGYNPDQPRLPAGSGRESGRWTDRNGPAVSSGSTRPTLEFIAYRPGSAPQADPSALPSTSLHAIPAAYTVVPGVPADAKVVIPPDGVPIEDKGSASPTGKLIAPAHASFRQVYAAGRAIASASFPIQGTLIQAALKQGGTYDFQRNVIRQEAYPAYAHASNYAVGVYMAGAGYSLWWTLHLAETYALFHSSNYGDKEQKEWTTRGWQDATAGRWK